MHSYKQHFKKRVLDVVSSIPKGGVLSYRQVAELAGSPHAARAVGNIMKGNLDPNIPCHRVIKSDGTLGGYNGFRGKKRELLLSEGYDVRDQVRQGYMEGEGSTSKRDQMRAIRDEVLNLSLSPLYEYRTKNHYFPVIGEGSHDASIIFVGEAPGRNEAKTGRPFCGAAGKILDELLDSVGVPRDTVYITNIVKDRPPENRDPNPEEIEVYGPFLDRQIDLIQPQVIATLGRYSMNYIMKKFGLDFEVEPISTAHGKVYAAEASYGKIHIVPLYHPAAAIYNQELKSTLRKDFEVLKQFLKN